MRLRLRKILFWLHLILGLSAGSVIAVVALTGTLLAFEPQIVALSERDVRQVEVPTNATRLELDVLLEKITTTNPKNKPSAITWWSDPHTSVLVQFGRDESPVFLNPYDGTTLGTLSKTHDFMHWVVDLHRRLTLGDTGRLITGISCLMMLGLSISGLCLWWPKHWKWRALKPHLTFMRNWRGKARDWNWHNAIGFWCLPLLIMTTLTGSVIAFQWANDLLFHATGNTPPPPRMKGEKADTQTQTKGKSKTGKRAQKNRTQAPHLRLPLAALATKAEAQVPGWQSIQVRFGKPAEPITFNITEPAGLNPHPRGELTFDATSGAQLKWTPWADQNMGRKARTWVKLLHTGEGGRWPLQLLLCLTALGTLMLIWTGFAMSWRRFFGKKKKATS